MELNTHFDKIVSSMARWKSGEKDRASDAGEMREEIGSLLDLTGLNKKAFAFVRMLDKQEPDKRADILRSLTPLLDMMDAHWNGNETPDFFEAEPEPVEPVRAPSYTPDPDFVKDPDIKGDSDDFDAHLAEVAAE